MVTKPGFFQRRNKRKTINNHFNCTYYIQRYLIKYNANTHLFSITNSVPLLLLINDTQCVIIIIIGIT